MKETKDTMTRSVLILTVVLAPMAAVHADEVAPVTVSYRLPADGELPKTYRVTLAITPPDNPDWIVSTFVSGAVRTVTEENQGRFTETWNGLDDNFMPVPPGKYGVKGIFMPAEVWAPDGKPHTLRPKILSGPSGLSPRHGRGEDKLITGDQVAPGLGDVAVGPDGVAVFYWKFLENALNPYRLDLSQPLGPEQLLGGFSSGGTGGGDHVTTDGETIWAVAPTDAVALQTQMDGEVFLYPPFLFRADQKPFGNDNMIRRNVTLTEGRVTGLAAWRPDKEGPALLFVAERGKLEIVGKHPHGKLDLYGESANERVNILRVLNGDTAEEISRVPVVEPTALVAANQRLYLLEKREEDWAVRSAPLPRDGKLDPAVWSKPVSLRGLKDPRDLAIDSAGRFFVADAALNRVLRFSPDRRSGIRQNSQSERDFLRSSLPKFVLDASFGAADAQREGYYDPETSMQPIRLALRRDKTGRESLLVVENEGSCRVAEWTPDGELLRDWGYSLSGNTGFAVDPKSPQDVYLPGGNNTFLRYHVNYDTADWKLQSVWHGIHIDGLTYPEILHHAGRKYVTFKRFGRDGTSLFRFDGDRLLPSAGIILEKRQGQPNAYFTWHDANGNGKRDADEISPLDMPRGLDRYWGDYRQDDLSVLAPRAGTQDVYRLPVTRLDDHGNPIYGVWEKVFTDEIYAARAADTGPAIYGGNEAVSAFNGDWGSVRALSDGEFVVNMRGGTFSANHGWQQKLSRYVPNGQGGLRQKWRVGRIANITSEPTGVHGSIHVTRPMHGLIGIVDQSRAGMHVFTWDSGLYVDTLMLPADREYDTVYGSPGEFFTGAAHKVNDRVFLQWGKTMPFLFEVEGWTAENGIRPISGLPATVAITALQIASPPELAIQIRGGAGSAKIAHFQPLPGSGPALDGSMEGWESCEPVRFGDHAADVEVRCGFNPDTFYLRWELKTQEPINVPPMPSPERIFTHDRAATTLSLYLQADPAAAGANVMGRPGDVRLVFGLHDDDGTIRPAAIGLYPTWNSPGEARPFTYASPSQRTSFAHVAKLDDIKLTHRLSDDRRILVLATAIPRSMVLSPGAGSGIRQNSQREAVLTNSNPGKPGRLTGAWRTMGNFEVTIAGARKLWWSNADGSASRETKDEPTEARLYPGSWSQIVFTPLIDGLSVRTWLVNGPWTSKELKYTGTAENKRLFQEYFDRTTFPPDDRSQRLRGAEAMKTWRLANTRPTDHCLYLDDGHPLYHAGCNLYFATTWIRSPEAQEIEIEFPMQHQNNISAWLNDTRLTETSREKGVYHTVKSPQTVTLKSGWNQLFLRGYALGYDLHFGAILKSDADRLWQIRLVAQP